MYYDSDGEKESEIGVVKLTIGNNDLLFLGLFSNLLIFYTSLLVACC